jgi:hypothetical protein
MRAVVTETGKAVEACSTNGAARTANDLEPPAILFFDIID